MEILTMGEKIRRKRKSLRLTLKDVAGDCVTPAQLSYVESDKCKPSSSLLKYICGKIDLDIEYVLETESQQARKYCEYYMDEYEFYMKRGELEEASDKLRIVEKLATEYKLDGYTAIVCYRKGTYALEKGDYTKAADNFLTAMQIFSKLGETEFTAKCYINLGIVNLNRNYVDDALVFLSGAMKLINAGEMQDKSISQKAAVNIAKAYHRIGNYEECKNNLLLAIKEIKVSGDCKDMVEFLEEAVFMDHSIFRLTECDQYLDETIKLCKSSGQENNLTTLSILKALAHIKLGDYETGIDYINKNVDYSTIRSDQRLLGCLLKAVCILLDNGYLDISESILNSVGDISNIQLNVISLYLKSKLYKDSNISKSYDYLLRASKSLDMVMEMDIIVKVSSALGEMYRKDKKYKDALEYMLKAAKLYSAEDISC